MVSRAFPIVVVALALSACGARDTLKIFEPVTVKEPVAVKAEPPAELMQPYRGVPLPIFVAPGHPSAAVCTSADGVKAITGIVSDLRNRDAAWREWAGTPLPVKR